MGPSGDGNEFSSVTKGDSQTEQLYIFLKTDLIHIVTKKVWNKVLISVVRE